MKTFNSYLGMLLASAIFSLLLVSCSKEDSDPSPASDIYIRYKLNGNRMQFVGGPAFGVERTLGIVSSPSQIFPLKEFMITGANASQSQIIGLQIFTDAIRTGTYIYKYGDYPYLAATSGVQTDTSSYGIHRPGDSIVFTITRFADEKIDGTFSGKLSSYKLAGGVIVSYNDGYLTEGEFKNIWMPR